MPLISVGMPVYNGEHYIETALDSILGQSFGDFELIISDNASTDKTAEICRYYRDKDTRIRYFRNGKNLGAANNFNRVFNLSSGKYFMWAAHDDVYAPDFMAKCFKVLEQNLSIVLCFSKTAFIDEQGKYLSDYEYYCNVSSDNVSKRFLDLVIGDYVVIEIFGLIRSDILRKTPLIADYVAADRVLLGELTLYGPFFEVPEYLFFHREHPQRSAKVYRTFHEYIAWWAPSKKNRLTFPTWKYFFETLAAIGRGPINRNEKLKCYLKMARWVYSKRDKMIKDLIMASKYIHKNKC